MSEENRDIKFDAWRDSLPAAHWSKYDLAACRLGWDAAKAVRSGGVDHIADAGKMVEQLLVDADEIAGWGAGNEAGRVREVAAELSRLSAENAELRKEIERRDQSFDLRWNSDMRAIKRWHKATGRTMTLPDHTDLSVWLFGQLEAAEAKLEEAAKVLEPFAALASTAKHVSKADDVGAWGFKDAVVTWGDFRASKSFLANLKGAE